MSTEYNVDIDALADKIQDKSDEVYDLIDVARRYKYLYIATDKQWEKAMDEAAAEFTLRRRIENENEILKQKLSKILANHPELREDIKG